MSLPFSSGTGEILLDEMQYLILVSPRCMGPLHGAARSGAELPGVGTVVDGPPLRGHLDNHLLALHVGIAKQLIEIMERSARDLVVPQTEKPPPRGCLLHTELDELGQGGPILQPALVGGKPLVSQQALQAP